MIRLSKSIVGREEVNAVEEVFQWHISMVIMLKIWIIYELINLKDGYKVFV